MSYLEQDLPCTLSKITAPWLSSNVKSALHPMSLLTPYRLSFTALPAHSRSWHTRCSAHYPLCLSRRLGRHVPRHSTHQLLCLSPVRCWSVGQVFWLLREWLRSVLRHTLG